MILWSWFHEPYDSRYFTMQAIAELNVRCSVMTYLVGQVLVMAVMYTNDGEGDAGLEHKTK